MKIKITGATGGIGSAIKKVLEGNEFTDLEHAEWLIFAQGVIDESDLLKTFDINTFICIDQTQQALTTMKGVIYISSTSAMTANSSYPIYSASKSALNTYMLAMSKAHPNLQFYALCPGPTNTKLWRSLNISGTPQEPEEVANVVVDILNGKFKSGAIITIRNGIVSV